MWKTYIVIFSEKTTVFWFYNLAISAIRKGTNLWSHCCHLWFIYWQNSEQAFHFTSVIPPKYDKSQIVPVPQWGGGLSTLSSPEEKPKTDKKTLNPPRLFKNTVYNTGRTPGEERLQETTPSEDEPGSLGADGSTYLQRRRRTVCSWPTSTSPGWRRERRTSRPADDRCRDTQRDDSSLAHR